MLGDIGRLGSLPGGGELVKVLLDTFVLVLVYKLARLGSVQHSGGASVCFNWELMCEYCAGGAENCYERT